MSYSAPCFIGRLKNGLIAKKTSDIKQATQISPPERADLLPAHLRIADRQFSRHRMAGQGGVSLGHRNRCNSPPQTPAARSELGARAAGLGRVTGGGDLGGFWDFSCPMAIFN